MENQKIRYFILFLTIIFSNGCETDVINVNMPEFRQKLVVTSFLSPSDTISYFTVQSNRKIYGELNTEEPLGLLKGFISDGTIEVALDTTSKGFSIKRDKMAIEYGGTYKIRVTSENGLSAEATCTVPAKREFSFRADTSSYSREYPDGMVIFGGNGKRVLNFNISFMDIAGEQNFYRIYGKLTASFTNPRTQIKHQTNNTLALDKEYLIDNGTDGKDILINTTGNYGYVFGPDYDSVYLKVYLYNTEKSYYLYHKSINTYNYGDNPFSEATPIFSNISGGLGIFTSYTVDSLIIRFK